MGTYTELVFACELKDAVPQLAFYRKFGSTSTKNSIVLVKVERAAPLVSPAYDTGRSETQIFNQWQVY